MENINLAVGYGEKRNRNVLGSGMRWIVVMTVLVVAVYLGLLGFRAYLDSSNSALGTQYQSERQSFMNQDAMKVLDFSNRIAMAKDLSPRQRDAVMDFRALESLIVPGVRVDSYTYDEDGESVTLKCVTEQYDTVAKQILSFKGSPYFTLTNAGKTSADSEKQSVSFDATLKINQ